ncbi:MAG: DNA polymerase III subunit gamma and tau [Nocardiopsaceae bacterium]|jgi:DNA polymerase-3 subunit gamma/tau|nr:DNA polymerase III subunit gamma and tau [Nocardiopsaceae bacterium]
MAGDVPSAASKAGDADRARPEIPDAPIALYRRYRPATFAEVKGQDHVTEPLRQALRSGRVHHAYLFSGPRGCGKTSSARILARSLNCEEGPTPDPCGTCASCVALAPAGPGSIDVIEIDAASHGGIDDARDLRERAFYSPVAARYKIYIIDEAHMVTGAGFNALLKLVEEPPPHLKFVFATTEPEKVIATIRSRTHHYPFRLVPPAILRELLEQILASEQVTYEPSVLPVVIRAGAGSARDALSVLDQLIAGADESGLRYDRAIALLGYTDETLLDEMTEAFAASDGAAVFLSIDHVVEAGHDPRRFAMDLLDRLRDLIVLAAVPGAGVSGLLDASEDQIERMRKQAAEFGQDRLAKAAETISNGLIEMRGATSPRLLLELMCAQVLLPASATPGRTASEQEVGDLTARLERLERQLAAGGAGGSEAGPSAARPASGRPAAGRVPGQGSTGGLPDRAPAPAPDRTRASAPDRTPAPDRAPAATGGATAPPASSGQAGAADADELRSRWPDVLENVRDTSKVAWILLGKATIDTVEGNVITMAFDSEGNAKGFVSSGSDGYLANVLERMFGFRPVIRATANQAATSGGGRGPARRAESSSGSSSSNFGAAAPAPDASASAGASTGNPGSSSGSSPASAQSPPAAGRDTSASASTGSGGGEDSRSGRGSRGGRGRDGQSGGGKADSIRPTDEPAATRSSRQPRRSGKTTAKPTRRGESSGPDLADDPRPHTDAVPDPSGRDLTGTDLIMRELGGRMIEET